MGTGKESVALGTEFSIAIGVLPLELSACQIQCSELQIGQDSPIYMLI